MNTANNPETQLLIVAVFARPPEMGFPEAQQLRDDLLGRICLAGLDAVNILQHGAFVVDTGEYWLMVFETKAPHQATPLIDEGLAAAGLGRQRSEIAVSVPIQENYDSEEDLLTPARLPVGRPSALDGQSILALFSSASKLPPIDTETVRIYEESLHRLKGAIEYCRGKETRLGQEKVSILEKFQHQISGSLSFWPDNPKLPASWVERLFEWLTQRNRRGLYQKIRECAGSFLDQIPEAVPNELIQSFLAAPWNDFHAQRTALKNLDRALTEYLK